MTGLWYRARAEARRRWRAWVGLALIIGVLGGVAAALAAGARRTGTAFDRLIIHERALDVLVVQGGYSTTGPTPPDFLDRVARLPEVAESGRFGHVLFQGGRTAQGEAIGEPDYLSASVVLDADTLRLAQRAKLLFGTYPGP